ncbi:PAS domain S-box protein [Desulfovibrio sulfodismutans]|uniref:histidine kinase n=1 Tax=Desulfolutivibrio sulfodismutans TaxID=63561 RepID=A0A7K3NQM8_9BACT|nr:ATP-binding protein [Desulfolutivibrio sulfodismutans]NDY58095.1 PAS domain S-box protein [Desulfolutivibrio sulfodismutans]QLA13285.1 PAS domain S-box protein [Desulfolutivibrio sulfodismutans DSM 3696]
MAHGERYGLSIRTQLLSVTALVCAGFVVMALLTLYSFGHIQELTRTAIHRDMAEMTRNARIGRRFSESYAAVGLLFSAFSPDEASLREKGDRIVASCLSLLEENPAPEIKTAIEGFARSLDVILEDLVQASGALRMAAQAKSGAHLALDRLTGSIQDALPPDGQPREGDGSPAPEAPEAPKAKETPDAALADLREKLSQADSLLGRIDPVHADDPSQALALLDEIMLSLPHLAILGPNVAAHVEDTASALAGYKNAARILRSSMSDLAVGMDGLKHSKDGAMAVMEGLDERNTQTTLAVQNEIADIIDSTRRMVFFSTAAMVVVLLIIMGFFIKRIVNRPLQAILSGIESLRLGHLETPVRLNRSDEWGRIEEALNTLARDLSSSYSALRESEKNYRDIFEKASEGIFQTTPLGRLYSANPAMARILNYASSQELLLQAKDIGKELFTSQGDWEALVQGLLAAGETRGFETRMQRKDGQVIWVSINAHTILDASGDILYFEGTVTDITARKRAERRLDVLIRHLKTAVVDRTRKLSVKAAELEAANRSLTELDHMKSAFLSSVSHELRTPLTSILGFSKLILKDFERAFSPAATADPDTAARAGRIVHNLEIIANEGERLTRLINDVLDLSRIESGRMSWNDLTVNPAEVLARSVDAVRGQFEGNPLVRLTVSLSEDLPAIRVDPDRLMQVAINLLHNAAKFTPSGEVRLTARRLGGENVLRVRVEDTGVGVAPENLERIFDKFQQVKSGPTLEDKPRGTGLGLSICRQIVSHYGGRIWAESTPGQGTRVTFDLPLAQPQPLTKDAAG